MPIFESHAVLSLLHIDWNILYITVNNITLGSIYLSCFIINAIIDDIIS